MGKSQKEKDACSSMYSVVKMPGFKMDLHKQQQSLILNELTTSRQKLEEENRMLRDELAEAKMIIRLLKMKLDVLGDERAITTTGVLSKITKSNTATSKKKRFLFKPKIITRREAFLNPRSPGSKLFTPDSRRKCTTLPQGIGSISPRSSFSTIRDQADSPMRNRSATEDLSGSAFSERELHYVTANFERTRIKAETK